MKGHCRCEATGLSSHAIARAFGHCTAGGIDHPWDPADLRRCVDYCDETGISAEALTQIMTPISRPWASLMSEWPELVRSLNAEIALGTGRAPETYAHMKRLLKVTS